MRKITAPDETGTKETLRPTPRTAYFQRLIFAAALVVLSAFLQGARGAAVCVVSAGLCMAVDAVCCRLRQLPYDIKASEVTFWGVCAGLMMPATVPWGLVLLSSVICVVVGKHLFGASDNIVFCPPAIADAFLMICYPAEMLYFPGYGERVPIFGVFEGVLARSSEYSLKMGIAPSGGIVDNLLGLVAGPVGSSYIPIIIVCGVCLMILRGGSACASLSCLAVSAVLAFFFPRADISGWQSVIFELSSGYLMFGTMFLAAEPYRVPERRMGRVLYGAFLGYVTMMFRYFGQTEGSFLFALLITSALLSGFDRVCENIEYWKKKYVNSFESGKIQAANANTASKPKLSDTQEIVLPEKYRYNTPPINSQIKRHRRRRGDGKNGKDGDKGDNEKQ